MKRYQKKLGEILFQEKIIKAFQLDLALKHQKRWGGKLASIMIEMGSIKEDLAISFLEKHVGWKWITLNDVEISPPLLDIVKHDIAYKYHIIPLDFDGGRLTIATSYPTDYQTIKELRFMLGVKEINTVFAVETSLAKAIQKFYPMKITKKSTYRDVTKGMDMVKHICNTFPFNMERMSICTDCNAKDCKNLTLWLKKESNSPKRFILKEPSEIQPFTGHNRRLPGGSKSGYNNPIGRIEDLINFANSGKVVDAGDLREKALHYISGVDSCHGFNRLGKRNAKQYPKEHHGPHSLQSMVKRMGLFDKALKDNRILKKPDEKIKSKYGKKSYMNGA